MLKGFNIYRFFTQVRSEVKKVVWLDKKELLTSLFIVISVVCIFSLVILILDYGIHNVVKFLLNIGR